MLKVLQGLGQDADFSSRDGAEPARAKATKGQVTGRKRCQLNSDWAAFALPLGSAMCGLIIDV